MLLYLLFNNSFFILVCINPLKSIFSSPSVIDLHADLLKTPPFFRVFFYDLLKNGTKIFCIENRSEINLSFPVGRHSV